MLKALTKKEIADQLHDSEKWIIKTQELQRVWIFDNFQEAMSFILRVAFLAEQHNHHPVIKNVYNRVELQLNTHDADNQVTKLDIALANGINQIGSESE
jgi:4a-hydroxytetrahydrobiopterin dehydratase